ncbi:hypothetical protein F4803DRAFT_72401 [Xylaria telfairii]|nr:hypothetical protein F4803DRAFT_72401 [Xylaria telfairii]
MDEVSQTVFALAIAMIPSTSLAVALRIWDRFGGSQVPGWDDGLIILSWILSVILCAIIAALMKYGLGAHRGDVSLLEYTMFLKFQMLASISYSIGITSAKASFAVLYQKIFPVRNLIILNKAVVTFLLFQAIEESLIVIFKCRPVRKSWTPNLNGSCLDLHPLWYTTFGFNFTTDIILYMQPILIIWRLRMPAIKRFTIAVMLSLGFFVTGISIIRLTYVTDIDMDDTYQLAEALIWSAVEVCSLIVCSCIPSFRRLALKIPYLNQTAGLSTGHSSVTFLAQPIDPVPLQSLNQNEYTRPKSSKFNRKDLLPSTTHTTATALRTINYDRNNNDRFPQRIDSIGAMVGTREVLQSVKWQEDSMPCKARDMM